MRVAPFEQVAMLPPTVQEWSQSFEMCHRYVGVARTQSSRQLRMWSWGGDIGEAVLIVSELLTNTVNHGRVTGRSMRLRLALLENGGLLVEVTDPVPTFPHFRAESDASAENERGRGLLLVRAIGAEVSWFSRQRGGKTVRAFVSGGHHHRETR